MALKAHAIVICLLAVILPAQKIEANIYLCRHRIGFDQTESVCHCEENDEFRCSLQRAAAILEFVETRHPISSIVNETAEFESIVEEFAHDGDWTIREAELQKLLDCLIHVLALEIEDRNASHTLALSFARLGNLTGYYGNLDEKALRRIRIAYEVAEAREISLLQELASVGFVRRRVDDSFSLLRSALRMIDPDELPECPKIIQKYSQLCEVE
jgi:hypothetical protein